MGKLPKIKPLKKDVVNRGNTNGGGFGRGASALSANGAAGTKRLFWLYFPCMLIYMELVMKLIIYKELFNVGLIFTLLFSLSLGLFLTALCTMFQPKTNSILVKVISALLWVLFGTQAVYHKIFLTFLTIFSMQGAEQALIGFWKSALRGIWQTLPEIIIYFLPLLAFILWGKKQLLPRKANRRLTVARASASAVLFLVTVLIISASNGGAPSTSTKFYYFNSYMPDMTVKNFGVVTNLRLDLEHMIFGIDMGEEDVTPIDSQPSEPSQPDESSQPDEPTEQDPVAQIMDIDWNALIASEDDEELLKMHNYFSALEPTYENEYTGIFKGKNLILMTAEAFSPYAINETLTPTLYKMQQEGFNFTNFYTPSWGVSTSDGEYVANVGLIPKSGVWSYYTTGAQENFMAFSMAYQLKQEGYTAYGYHNNSYKYYKRHISHPNMGYIYKGYGNGLNVKKTWPESDLEMMQLTFDEFSAQQPFHAYFMTVSGHMDYTYIDNMMASKHRKEVEAYFGDTASLAVKAYYACNMELDRACEYLLQRLNELGIAEDTVIAISPDHYPYGLTNDQMDELAGKTLDKTFEMYKGVFLLYCQGQEPVTVDTLACSMDIIPTISNMFGLDYDSRLLMGYDIFSEQTERLVVMSNYSWITEAGFYNTKTKTFIRADGAEPTEEDSAYVKRIASIVANKFRYSTKILDRDYYRAVFGEDKTSAVPAIPGD